MTLLEISVVAQARLPRNPHRKGNSSQKTPEKKKALGFRRFAFLTDRGVRSFFFLSFWARPLVCGCLRVPEADQGPYVLGTAVSAFCTAPKMRLENSRTMKGAESSLPFLFVRFRPKNSPNQRRNNRRLAGKRSTASSFPRAWGSKKKPPG